MAKIIETSVTDAGALVIVTPAGTIMVNPANLSAEVRDAALLHGLKQKICDAAALERDPATGRSATPEDKYKAMRAVADRLHAGEWNARGEGDGSGGDGLLVRALAKVTGRPVDEIRPEVTKWDKKTQAAMRADPNIAPVIAELRAAADANKAKGVDTSVLLARIMPKA